MLYLILGWLWTITCAGFAFMVVAFSGGGYANNQILAKVDWFMKYLDISLYAVPTLCILGGVLMTIGHLKHWGLVYSWLLLPPIIIALYLVLVHISYKSIIS